MSLREVKGPRLGLGAGHSLPRPRMRNTDPLMPVGGLITVDQAREICRDKGWTLKSVLNRGHNSACMSRMYLLSDKHGNILGRGRRIIELVVGTLQRQARNEMRKGV